MSALDQLVSEMLANLPKDTFVDRTFGFSDILGVVELAERSLRENTEAKMEAQHAAALKAAQDPFHDFRKSPVFGPMAAQFWKADQVFPRILRNSLFIAIYSHAEYVLLSWCETISSQPGAPTLPKKKGKESHLFRYVRYLRDEVGLPLDDFAQWREWQVLDACRRARNCLAHEGGVVDDAEDRAKIATLEAVTIDESRLHTTEPLVLLLPGACEAAARNSQAFIVRVSALAERDLASESKSDV